MKKMLIGALIAAQIFSASCVAGQLPDGWTATGSHPEGYQMELVETEGVPAPAVMVKSKPSAPIGHFGTVMQQFVPTDYLGKRVKLTAWVKADEIKNWAGVWMRVDGENSKVLAFDNMHDRPIAQSSEWKQYSIVLDVDDDATNLAYGVLLSGKGTLYVDDFQFAVVNDTVKTTNVTRERLEAPKNTDF
ncbi:hypothetical protein [Pleionea sp. CnH1-48]|uniref:hypothetical protein n=1 Tax=Pleionea sp. CnH1-48 TaxID=2954494 RepID=UPI002097CFED|nr:hypothetical protein [Pleionea sp. CnH1-48]MCO7223037.1 hypothetical protein [Pleionea sp. CnH1-48]